MLILKSLPLQIVFFDHRDQKEMLIILAIRKINDRIEESTTSIIQVHQVDFMRADATSQRSSLLRRLTTLILTTGALCLVICPQKIAFSTEKNSRPNIVLILSDDMGYGQPGFNGGNKELTPNLDQLAAQGVQFKQFYTHSVCAPTRAALLTGRYAFRTWSDWRSEDFGKPSYLQKLGLTLARNEDGELTRRIHALDTNERTIAEALREAGYFTSIIGKWHCGEWLK